MTKPISEWAAEFMILSNSLHSTPKMGKSAHGLRRLGVSVLCHWRSLRGLIHPQEDWRGS